MMRPRFLALATSLFLTWPTLGVLAQTQLTLTDVQTIIAQAVSRAQEVSPRAVIAVTDVEGFVLGVWSVTGQQPSNALDPVLGRLSAAGAAIREAGTASYLSSNQNAFNSRVAQFIIQQNFPPGVGNRPPGPLVGVAFSNLPFSDVNRFKGPDAVPGNGFVVNSLGTGIQNTRLSGRCASVPLFKNGILVGGIGVFPQPEDEALLAPFDLELRNQQAGIVIEEDVALAGQIGFEPPDSVKADNVTNDGIRFPYVAGRAVLNNRLPFAGLPGAVAQPFVLKAAPPTFNFPKETFNGQTGEFRFPVIADPNPGTIQGQPRLTAAEVHQIIMQGAVRASTTRGAIRLPIGSAMQCWIVVIGNPNVSPDAPAASKKPPILGIFRTPNAPFFSFDVAAQKGRTALFFSSNTIAQSSRTVGFLGEDNYPPGINFAPPGPYGPSGRLNGQPSFNGLQLQFSFAPPFGYAPNPNLPNGITIFPGGFPLYRNGVLIGAVGISGDGVDQDDIVGVSGTVGFEAPLNVRADFFTLGGARLPYARLPRNAELENQ